MRATQWAEKYQHPMDAPGTSEASWRGWPALREFPALHLAGIASAVVVAPHPGDETLAVGGAIAMLAGSGAKLRVVVVGEEERSRHVPAARRPADKRTNEVCDALRVLGAPDAEVVSLGMSGPEVRERGAELTEALAGACAGFDLCLAPWEGDHHPDNEAVADAARTAVVRAGVPSLSYPVWLWHWARPEDTRVPWGRVHRIVLPEETRRLKIDAISCFTARGCTGRGTDGTLLPSEKVAHFIRDAEMVFR